MAEAAKIRMDYDRLDALTKIYARLVELGPEPDKELLYTCIVAFHKRLKVMLAKDQGSYMVTLNEVESQAMRDTWDPAPFPLPAYGAEIIRSSVAIVDKFLGNQKVKLCRVN